MGFSRNMFKRNVEPEPEIPQLAQTILSFVQANTWLASYQFVLTHPELLHEEAESILTLLANAAQKDGNDNIREILVDYRSLLRHCREIGIEEAFAGRLNIPPRVLTKYSEMYTSLIVHQRLVDFNQPKVEHCNVENLEPILPLTGHPDVHVESNAKVGTDNLPIVPFQFEADFQEAQAGKHLYRQIGDLGGLDQAIVAWERILQHPAFNGSSSEFHLAACNDGGIVYMSRYWVDGQLNDLNRALQIWQMGMQCSLSHSSYLPLLLSNLGDGLRTRYNHIGQLVDLEESIRVTKIAISSTLSNSPNLPVYLNNLGAGLRDLYFHTGQLTYLEESIRVTQTAIQSASFNNVDVTLYLSNLGAGLHDLYFHTGQLTHLEESLRVTQMAVEYTPSDSPDLPMYLNSLGAALCARYTRMGKLEDLEEAIRAWQIAVENTPIHSPILPSYLNNLGNGLSFRYIHTGQLGDLEESIRATQSAVKYAPADSPDLPIYLNNLGAGLRDRYTRTGQFTDLETAIYVMQTAVSQTSPNSPELARNLNNLGAGLRDRYARTGQFTDLEEAIRIMRASVSQTLSESPELARNLNSLGNGLRDRYIHTGQLADLDEAIHSYQIAIDHTSLGSLDLPSRLNNLGVGLCNRYALSGNLADREEALRVWRDACQHGLNIDREMTLEAANNWGRWALAHQAWEETNDAYAFGLTALEQLYKVQVLRQDRQSWQKDAPDLVINAAYALVRTNQLEQAVMVLEQGRARGLHESLARDQADLRALQHDAPELFAAYEDAAGRLHQLEAVERQQQIGRESNAPPPDWSAHRQQVAEATQLLDEAIARIRQLPDYATFLTPPDFTAVTAAVQPHTPLLYLVTTAVGSLGLLVQQAPPASNETVTITPIWADTFTEVDLNTFLVQQEDGQVIGGYLPGQLGQTAWLRASLANGLPQLGEKLMGPIAARLHDLDPDLKQVTLVPTGRLSLLPLHAAPYLQNDGETTFIDKFTVSYAPSAQTLAHSQQKLTQNGNHELPWLLAVGNPLPSKASSLPFARLEAEEIAEFFSDRAYLFCETAAHYEAVTAHLPQSAYLHFSCHGIFDTEQPLASGLLLSDSRLLTLADILDQFSLPQARLVVLSACQTAITDFQNVPDEVVGLPAGFLQAGVPGVVGSLWSVNDLSTMLLMRRFYELHMNEDNPLSPAEALRQAQFWLRDVTIEELINLFEKLMQTAPDRPHEAHMRMPYADAAALYRESVFAEDWGERPFAHPYYWAAFTFTGV